jgi:hypothetical protein
VDSDFSTPMPPSLFLDSLVRLTYITDRVTMIMSQVTEAVVTDVQSGNLVSHSEGKLK